MALIRTGPGVSAISGDLGGINFVVAGQRQVARQKQRKSAGTGSVRGNFLGNKVSSTEEARANLKKVTDAWLSLTTNQRNLWNTIAATERWPDRLGQARAPSGREAFISQSLYWRQSSSYALTSDAPSEGTAPAPYDLSFATSGGTLMNLTMFKLATTAAQPSWYVYAKPWYGNSTPPHARKCIFIGSSSTSNSAGSETLDVTDAWEQHWPFPQAGLRITFLVRLVTSKHFTSPPARLDTTFS